MTEIMARALFATFLLVPFVQVDGTCITYIDVVNNFWFVLDFRIQAIDLTFDRVENIKGSGEFVSEISINRMNRKTYTLRGNFTLNPPLSLEPEKYYVNHTFWSIAWLILIIGKFVCLKLSTKVYISPSGSSKFDLLAMQFPNITICESLNTNYRKYFMEGFKYPVSNLPYSNRTDEDFCDTYRSEKSVSGWSTQNLASDKSIGICPYLASFLLEQLQSGRGNFAIVCANWTNQDEYTSRERWDCCRRFKFICSNWQYFAVNNIRIKYFNMIANTTRASLRRSDSVCIFGLCDMLEFEN